MAKRSAPRRSGSSARKAAPAATTRRSRVQAHQVNSRPGEIPAPRRAPRARAGLARSRALSAREPETLQVEFGLRNVAGDLIRDSDTLFTFRRVSDSRQIGEQLALHLRGTRVRFAIPPQTSVPVVCEIDPKRYRFVRSPVFFGTPGPPVQREVELFREPGEWTPAFTSWSDLPHALADLRRVLQDSDDIVLRRKPGDGPDVPLGKLVGAAYDAITGGGKGGDAEGLAKAALLNTYYRLRTVNDPIADTAWFSRVRRIIAIDRERFMAFVDPEMETLVRHISDNIGDFRGAYEQTPVGDHRGNVPEPLRSRITSMVSIKSSHDHANFQLTISHLAGPDEVLLDADLDESGRFVAHLLDLLKHKVTGGTHPHDIHELLWHLDGGQAGFELGYALA